DARRALAEPRRVGRTDARARLGEREGERLAREWIEGAPGRQGLEPVERLRQPAPPLAGRPHAHTGPRDGAPRAAGADAESGSAPTLLAGTIVPCIAQDQSRQRAVDELDGVLHARERAEREARSPALPRTLRQVRDGGKVAPDGVLGALRVVAPAREERR